MISKTNEKRAAIAMRRAGKTYNEILKEIPVAKSTLSLWLRDVGLANRQKQRLSEKRYQAQLRGAAARKQDRLYRTDIVVEAAKKQIGKVTKRELLLLGAALYWAEGSKEKSYRPSVLVGFANSDPNMIKLYMSWLREILLVANSEIKLTLHLHENRITDLAHFHKFWLNVTKLPSSCLTKPIIKRHKPKTLRKNIGDTYKGLVAIKICRSTMMNRKIQGWICGIINAQ